MWGPSTPHDGLLGWGCTWCSVEGGGSGRGSRHTRPCAVVAKSGALHQILAPPLIVQSTKPLPPCLSFLPEVKIGMLTIGVLPQRAVKIIK